MALSRVLPQIVAILAAVVAAMVAAARAGQIGVAAVSALMVPLTLLTAAVLMNRPLWQLEPRRVTAEAPLVAARRNAILLALAYGWGAATLLTVYPVAGLRWYHWWQYGAVLGLVALGLATYARALVDSESWFRSPARQLMMLRLTILHGTAILGGLGWLILSGKAASPRDDWAANVVFLAGGVTLAGLSAVAAFTQTRLSRRLNGS